ncbi:transposase [Streptomyces sp. NBC_00272]|nr:transposase [Streptomyces sp. NBC_01205]
MFRFVRPGSPLDAQSVKTSTSVPASSQGIDAGKKIVGRKRSIVTDTIGLLLAVLVTAASVQDSAAGTALLDQVAVDHLGIRKVWVDGGYRQHLVEHAATLGIDMEITTRKPGTRGQGLHPDFEAVGSRADLRMADAPPAPCPRLRNPAARSEAVIHIAMTDLMARRLTSENTISWRDPKKPTKHTIPV